MDEKTAALFATSGERTGKVGFHAFCATSTCASFDDDLSGPGNNGGRTERERLRNHVAEVALNDKQLFGNVPQFLQSRLELFYGNRLAQVGVDHQHAV